MRSLFNDLKCIEMLNGMVCSVQGDGEIEKIINEGNLHATRTLHKNGERITLEKSTGEWVGTVIKRGDDDGKMILIKSR